MRIGYDKEPTRKEDNQWYCYYKDVWHQGMGRKKDQQETSFPDGWVLPKYYPGQFVMFGFPGRRLYGKVYSASTRHDGHEYWYEVLECETGKKYKFFEHSPGGMYKLCKNQDRTVNKKEKKK